MIVAMQVMLVIRNK